jgi:uncharacterized protein YceK
MKTIAPIAALCLLLSGCATIFTPRRCEQAAAGLATTAQIAQVLIDYGVEPAKAAKLADAVATGRMLIAAACAQARPGGDPETGQAKIRRPPLFVIPAKAGISLSTH